MLIRISIVAAARPVLTVSVVPEPGSLALGVAGLLYFISRRAIS